MVTFEPGPTSSEIGCIPIGFKIDSIVAFSTFVINGGSATVSPGINTSADSGS